MTSRAAEHMVTAYKTIFRDNSSPYATRYPSGGILVCTGEQDSLGNCAVGLSLDELPDAASRLSSGHFPSMMIRPGDRAAEFESIVEPFGFSHAAGIPAMEMDISQLERPLLGDEFTYERLNLNSDGKAWALALAFSYPVGPLASQAMSPPYVALSEAPDAAVQYFQVRSGSTIAGVSAMILADGVAGIYCVATHPDFRHRGIGAAITALPLCAARDLGYETGVLQSSMAGYPIYRRLGFEDAGEVQIYSRHPQSPLDASAI